jgi:hypothetical protein
MLQSILDRDEDSPLFADYTRFLRDIGTVSYIAKYSVDDDTNGARILKQITSFIAEAMTASSGESLRLCRVPQSPEIPRAWGVGAL